MPELPEVETLARLLRPMLLGRTVLSADLRWPRSLAFPLPAKFKRQIAGQEILEISRRGKFFNIRLSDFHLLLHLRMSGNLLAVQGEYSPARHDRLLLPLSDGTTFVFNDPRKFGRVWLLDNPTAIFSSLGPEPLADEFTPAWLFSALHAHRRQLKPLLLDQKFIAGLGNIYTDETLHLAKLHPLIPSNTVTEAQAHALWQSIRDVLQEGIRSNGASIDWVYRGGDFQNHFSVYGREGEACPTCGTAVERIVIGQRGTHFCPTCQKNPVK
jgi:formamidopyrimidine-DNA glycosylase